MTIAASVWSQKKKKKKKKEGKLYSTRSFCKGSFREEVL